MCATSFIIKRKQVKNTVRYQFSTMLAKSKRPTNLSVDENAEASDHVNTTTGGDLNKLTQPPWETVGLGHYLAKWEWCTPDNPTIPLLSVSPRLFQVRINLKSPSWLMGFELEALAWFRVERKVEEGLVKGRIKYPWGVRLKLWGQGFLRTLAFQAVSLTTGFFLKMVPSN